jgi:nicotinamidase-related amidase
MNCLVLVDLQKGFLTEDGGIICKRIETLINEGGFNEIVATQYVNSPGSPCDRICDYHDCMEGSDEAKLVPPADTVVKVFKKSGYSCFTDEFKEYLADNEIDDLTFVGFDTTACVLASAYSAFDMNIDVHVITDCTDTILSSEVQECMITMMKCNLGDSNVVTMKEFLERRKENWKESLMEMNSFPNC